MVQRQQLTRQSTAMGSAVAQSAPAELSYGAAAGQIWRHTDAPPTSDTALQREMVRYATLAASSHNTQCWKFELRPGEISVLPDLERRCPAVDPDDHHLYASLGCATENLLQAAKANGLQGVPEVDPNSAIKVHLEPTEAIASPLFEAIPQRQSTRTDYDGQPLPSDELKQLEQAAAGHGVNLILLTEKQALEQILEYAIAGNTAQINDPAFVNELKSWIRFSEAEAVRTGDGLFAKSSGNPTAPRWLGSLLFDLFFTPKAEAKKYTRQIRSSAGLAIFVSDHNTPTHWIEAGRCYQRFALQATALGIRTAFLNQPVEVVNLRSQFADYLGIGGRRPDLVVRFGHGPEMPRSLRRPVEAVIV